MDPLMVGSHHLDYVHVLPLHAIVQSPQLYLYRKGFSFYQQYNHHDNFI
jgi:hypothetical protein